MTSVLEQRREDLLAALPDLEQPVSQARGLPAFVYDDPDWFEGERQAIFATGWMAVAFRSDVREPGSIAPIEIAGWSLLVSHARDGQIRVFHNICSHRGMKLTDEAKQCTGITCPWHAWSFDLAGKLIATANIGGPGVRSQAGFRAEEHGLREVRSAEWLDVIFVNIDGKAPDLQDYTKSFRKRLSAFDFGATAQAADLAYEYDYAANWKICIEGGIEDYHIPFVHPQLGPGGRFLAEYGDDRHVGIVCWRSIEDGRKRFINASQSAIRPLPTFPHVPDSGDVEASLILLLFPNLFMATVLDHSTVSIIVPQDANRTRYRRRFRLVEPAATAAEYEATRQKLLAGWMDVTQQDGPIWGEVQRMMKQRREVGFRSAFSRHWEGAIHEFQRKVAYKMLGEKTPARIAD